MHLYIGDTIKKRKSDTKCLRLRVTEGVLCATGICSTIRLRGFPGYASLHWVMAHSLPSVEPGTLLFLQSRNFLPETRSCRPCDLRSSQIKEVQLQYLRIEGSGGIKNGKDFEDYETLIWVCILGGIYKVKLSPP